jgi:hypothetical protein
MRYYEVSLYLDEIRRSKEKKFFPFVCSLENDSWDLEQKLLQGEIINDPDFLVSLKSIQDGIPDSRLANDSDLLLFSDEVLSVLKTAAITGYQTLPAKIWTRKGTQLPGYSTVANLTKAVSCLDLEKSSYTIYSELNPPPSSFPEYMGKPHVIQSIVIKGSLIPDNVDIFRLGERKNRILCSQRFVDTWAENGFNNLSFEAVEIS